MWDGVHLIKKKVLNNDIIIVTSLSYFVLCDDVTGGSNFVHSFFDTEL